MLIKDKTIAIVGGGPGGLTLARLMQMQGAQVKVYERDVNASARVQGSPLDLHEESGLAALRKADLLNEFKKNFRPGADRMLIANPQAEICYSDHTKKPEEDFGNNHFRPEIDRGPLRNMLLNSLQPGTVVWNSHFISMEAQNEGWLLHFKNGGSARADLVVAADGANSKIRPYVTDVKAVYSGITMLEGNVYHASEAAPQINAMIDGGKIMAFGNKKNLLLGQKGNGDLGFYASLKVDENWAVDNGLNYSDKGQLVDWFKMVYPDWSSIWLELFENAAMPIVPRPIYCVPLNQTWETLPNVTLLGDAAHVCLPLQARVQTWQCSMLELSECLLSAQYETLHEAISDYETAMRKRAAKAAGESLENGDKMHAEDALSTMVALFGTH